MTINYLDKEAICFLLSVKTLDCQYSYVYIQSNYRDNSLADSLLAIKYLIFRSKSELSYGPLLTVAVELFIRCLMATV